MAVCTQCGKELLPDSSFCTFCGASTLKEAVPKADDLSSAPYTPPQPTEPNTFAGQPAFSPAYTATPPPLAYTAPPPTPVGASVYNRVPERTEYTRINFVNSFLSLVILASLLIIAFNTGVFGFTGFLCIPNLSNILLQFCFYGVIAMAVVLSTRAKGLDFSIVPLIALSGVIVAIIHAPGGSLLLGILLAIIVCAVIGLLNGVLIAYAHTPAIITTLVTGLIARSCAYWLTNGKMISIPNRNFMSINPSLLSFGILAVAIIIAFLMIMLTPLGTPMYRREKKTPLAHMLAYAGSGLIAALAGIRLLTWGNMANASISGYEPFILLVYGFAMGSRAFDNRFAPAFTALLPALFYAVANIVVSIMRVNPWVQSIIFSVFALEFILIAFLVRPELRGKLPILKN